MWVVRWYLQDLLPELGDPVPVLLVDVDLPEVDVDRVINNGLELTRDVFVVPHSGLEELIVNVIKCTESHVFKASPEVDLVDVCTLLSHILL